MKKGLRGERGVEPLAMKIFAGIIMLVLGIGIGYAVYTWAGKGTQQMLSFSVSLPSGATMSIPENKSDITVSVTLLPGSTYNKTVTLTATGTPTGVTVSFSPASGTPTFGSTMTISVGDTATAGTTTLTIKATGTDGVEQTATFTLTVA